MGSECDDAERDTTLARPPTAPVLALYCLPSTERTLSMLDDLCTRSGGASSGDGERRPSAALLPLRTRDGPPGGDGSEYSTIVSAPCPPGQRRASARGVIARLRGGIMKVGVVWGHGAADAAVGGAARAGDAGATGKGGGGMSPAAKPLREVSPRAGRAAVSAGTDWNPSPTVVLSAAAESSGVAAGAGPLDDGAPCAESATKEGVHT